MTNEELTTVRMDYLKESYEPVEECLSCTFKCDFRPIGDRSDQCPCEWALDDGRKREYIKRGKVE